MACLVDRRGKGLSSLTAALVRHFKVAPGAFMSAPTIVLPWLDDFDLCGGHATTVVVAVMMLEELNRDVVWVYEESCEYVHSTQLPVSKLR